MSFENNKIDADLIGKYLAGEANPEEAMLLDEWLADPNNKKEFEQYARLWNLMPASVIPEIPSARQSWAEVQTTITRARKAVRVRQIMIGLAVAATIAVTVLISLQTFEKGDENIKTNNVDLTINNIFTSGHEKRTDTLVDGSVVTINKNSSISYSKTFNETARQLTLTGEAFFNVMPDKSKPFIITIDDLKIEVVGTSFNIRKLHSPETIEVQVRSGIVKMYTNEKQLMVNKDQTGVYTKADRELRLKDTIDVNSIGYATNSFYFNDISLTKACGYLAHAFNVDIKIDQRKFGECRLTAEFDNKSLTYILEVINATFNTTYKREGNTYSINGKGCQ